MILPFCLFALVDFDCNDPLGMESGEITSDQIVASSQYNPSWSPERSRLNYYENAWTPAEDTNKEWIQVPHYPTISTQPHKQALSYHFVCRPICKKRSSPATGTLCGGMKDLGLLSPVEAKSHLPRPLTVVTSPPRDTTTTILPRCSRSVVDLLTQSLQAL